MSQPLPGRARGATLLVLLAIVAVGVLAGLLKVVDRIDYRSAPQARSDHAMAEARRGLLAWSATHASKPGQLPCPENTALIGSATEGMALASCTLPATGRLPWRTLGVPRLYDGAGEPLWYVLSAGFGSGKINSATAAQLSVDGVAASAVAIVIAAGARLTGQSRPTPGSSSPPLAVNYLDDINNTGGDSFVSSVPVGQFNDRLLPVTRAQLMGEVETRVVAEVALRLRAYYAANAYFPYASAGGGGDCASGLLLGFLPHGAGDCSHPAFPASLPGALAGWPAWFAANDWPLHVQYQVAPGCVALTPGSATPPAADCGGAGRLTVGDDTGVKAVLALAHRGSFIVAP